MVGKSKKTKNRPSEARRQALKKSESNKFPPISNLTPIQRYYDVADKLRVLFYDNVERHKLDDAYVYGIRFAKFSTDSLPEHDYYRVKKPEMVQLKKKNQKDLRLVIDKLEEVVQLMDLEELERAEIRRREEAALKKIREREAAMRKEEEERNAAADLISRLNALDTMFPKTPTGVGETQTKVELPSYDEATMNQAINMDSDMPPPIPPPIPFSAPAETASLDTNNLNQQQEMKPPSYRDLLSRNFADYEQDSVMNLKPATSTSTRNLMNEPIQAPPPTYQSLKGEPATLINPLGPLLPASLDIHGEIISENIKIKVPITTLRYTSKREYDTLQKIQKVQVFALSTYQGRYNETPGKDSTNGCTVISPLVAVNHLTSNGGGISDIMIENIIDNVAPSILTRVRRKLGLSGNALIIPSDVHDFLVDEKILKQEMFVGVCGGNLLDIKHVNEFLNLLENEEVPESRDEEKKDSSKKLGAALFFHEHVVSILKVVLPDGSSWYDLVDSLPRRKNDKLGGTRTRCKDRDSLQSVLQWYACDKFSPSDNQYIDTNDWDDVMCNFDPRVFQAFVWKEI